MYSCSHIHTEHMQTSVTADIESQVDRLKNHH